MRISLFTSDPNHHCHHGQRVRRVCRSAICNVWPLSRWRTCLAPPIYINVHLSYVHPSFVPTKSKVAVHVHCPVSTQDLCTHNPNMWRHVVHIECTPRKSIKSNFRYYVKKEDKKLTLLNFLRLQAYLATASISVLRVFLLHTQGGPILRGSIKINIS